jgi:hypothetical protein
LSRQTNTTPRQPASQNRNVKPRPTHPPSTDRHCRHSPYLSSWIFLYFFKQHHGGQTPTVSRLFSSGLLALDNLSHTGYQNTLVFLLLHPPAGLVRDVVSRAVEDGDKEIRALLVLVEV